MTEAAVPQPGRFLLAAQHLRLFAVMLDYLLIMAGLKLLEQLLLGEGWDLRLVQRAADIFPLWWIAALVGLFLLKDVGGASVGKWVMGITVRRIDNPTLRPPLWRRVARNLSLLLLPLDVYYVFRDPQFRRLGERWFGTVVIVRQPELYIATRAFGLGVLFLGFVLSALLISSWNLRRTAAYQLAFSAVQSHPALATSLGDPVKVDASPSMELRFDEGSAVFVFQAKGKQRSADVRVRLVLQRTPVAWTVGSIDLPTPGPNLVKDAPAKP